MRYVPRTPNTPFRRLKGRLLRLRIITLRLFRIAWVMYFASIRSARPIAGTQIAPILYALSLKVWRERAARASWISQQPLF